MGYVEKRSNIGGNFVKIPEKKLLEFLPKKRPKDCTEKTAPFSHICRAVCRAVLTPLRALRRERRKTASHGGTAWHGLDL